jgi:hypothetical protein
MIGKYIVPSLYVSFLVWGYLAIRIRKTEYFVKNGQIYLSLILSCNNVTSSLNTFGEHVKMMLKILNK